MEKFCGIYTITNKINGKIIKSLNINFNFHNGKALDSINNWNSTYFTPSNNFLDIDVKNVSNSFNNSFLNHKNFYTYQESETISKQLVNVSFKSEFKATIGIIENDYSLKEAYEQYFTKAGYSVYLIPHDEKAFTDCLA